jgi:hypothetical protein
MINKKYYFVDTNLDVKYPTLWNGFLNFNKNEDTVINFLDIDNILIDICNVNFYVNIDSNNIYLSLDQDEKYYFFQFEKHIKKVIKKIEEISEIYINYGEFNANELKHFGLQYKYNITRTNDTKIVLKKKTLQWDNDSNLCNELSNLKL